MGMEVIITVRSGGRVDTELIKEATKKVTEALSELKERPQVKIIFR